MVPLADPGPLAIGLTVFLAHIVAIPVTNCCINRALPCLCSLHVLHDLVSVGEPWSYVHRKL